MRFIKTAVVWAYWLALIWLAVYAFRRYDGGEGLTSVFHHVSYYLPSIAAIFVVSLQIDYLDSIVKGGNVDIKARMIDFIHWLMLVSINVSTWFAGHITVWWFLTQLIALVVIGSSVGIGLAQQRTILITSEKVSAIFAACGALVLGLAMWGLRNANMLSTKPESWTWIVAVSILSLGVVWVFASEGLSREELGPLKIIGPPLALVLGFAVAMIGKYEQFDYGWWMDTLTSVVAITLVSGFILHDLAVIRRDYTGYYRSVFLKGIFGCNILIFLAWLHALLLAPTGYARWMLENLGFTYVTLVGNTIYAYYYVAYEYYRYKQTHQ